MADGTTKDRPSIQEQFEAFHNDNPWVFAELITLTRELTDIGHGRVGIGMLWEVLRWQYKRQTVSPDFKLNNNFRSRYARLIQTTCPDLQEVYETRELRAV